MEAFEKYARAHRPATFQTPLIRILQIGQSGGADGVDKRYPRNCLVFYNKKKIGNQK